MTTNRIAGSGGAYPSGSERERISEGSGRVLSALREPVGTRYQDEDGWNGAHSVATTQAARDTVSRLYVIPSNDGGLVIDLHAGGMEVEISVEPDGRVSLVMAGPSVTAPARVSSADGEAER